MKKLESKKVKKYGNYKMNISGAIIVLALVAAILSVFAVLSAKNAYREMKLAENADQRIKDYYTADRKMGFVFNAIDDTLGENSPKSLNEINTLIAEELKNEGVESFIKEEEMIFTIAIDENRKLEACVSLDFSNKEMRVLSYKAIPASEGDYSSGMIDIWDGVINIE